MCSFRGPPHDLCPPGGARTKLVALSVWLCLSLNIQSALGKSATPIIT